MARSQWRLKPEKQERKYEGSFRGMSKEEMRKHRSSLRATTLCEPAEYSLKSGKHKQIALCIIARRSFQLVSRLACCREQDSALPEPCLVAQFTKWQPSILRAAQSALGTLTSSNVDCW